MKSSAVDPVGSTSSPRQLSLFICLQVLDKGLSLTQLLERHLIGLSTDRDRAFCAELSYGVCRYYLVLLEALNGLLKKPLKERERDVQLIMLLGFYQLRFMRVSDHAAVNESVKLLTKRKKTWAKGVVNAVLRNYQRRLKADDKAPSALLSEAEQRLAYPAWLSAKIESDWPDHYQRVLSAGNQQAPMVLRVDTRRISRQQYLDQMQDSSMSAQPHAWVDTAVILQRPVPVEQLPGFEQGLVSVQDAAAQIAGQLLACEPGMRVLDACAAPGGKTLHLLQSSPDIQLTALDKDAERMKRVQQNLDRAGLTAQLLSVDAADTQSWFTGEHFDCILLDAPCSATGIIRRHPDIRLLRTAADIEQLVTQQARLLQALWPLLKPGGRMLYSTCSIIRDENESQVGRFVAQQADCVEVPINSVQWGLARQPGRQILPGINDMDGFYYASLEKRI